MSLVSTDQYPVSPHLTLMDCFRKTDGESFEVTDPAYLSVCVTGVCTSASVFTDVCTEGVSHHNKNRLQQGEFTQNRQNQRESDSYTRLHWWFYVLYLCVWSHQGVQASPTHRQIQRAVCEVHKQYTCVIQSQI